MTPRTLACLAPLLAAALLAMPAATAMSVSPGLLSQHPRHCPVFPPEGPDPIHCATHFGCALLPLCVVPEWLGAWFHGR